MKIEKMKNQQNKHTADCKQVRPTRAAGGGSCGSGAMAAGFTNAFSGAVDRIDAGNLGINFKRAMAAAAIGGTASVLGGGKFANGAVTGAFSRMYNDDYRENVLLQNANRAAGLQGSSTPPNATYSFGGSFAAMMGASGFAVEYGQAKSQYGGVCSYVQTCGVLGLGLGAEVGLSAGLQSGVVKDSIQQQKGFVLFAGFGPASNLQVTVDSGSPSGAVKGLIGKGAIIGGGYLSCSTTYYDCSK